jgi:hypothetical protein
MDAIVLLVWGLIFVEEMVGCVSASDRHSSTDMNVFTFLSPN